MSGSGLPWCLNGKDSACNAGDVGSFPGSGRSHGEGNGNPLEYSGLKNPVDREAWWATVHVVAKSQIRDWATNTHSSIPARIIPWTEEHGELQSIGSQSWILLSNWARMRLDTSWFQEIKDQTSWKTKQLSQKGINNLNRFIYYLITSTY